MTEARSQDHDFDNIRFALYICFRYFQVERGSRLTLQSARKDWETLSQERWAKSEMSINE